MTKEEMISSLGTIARSGSKVIIFFFSVMTNDKFLFVFDLLLEFYVCLELNFLCLYVKFMHLCFLLRYKIGIYYVNYTNFVKMMIV